jgi:hypothetical protein
MNADSKTGPLTLGEFVVSVYDTCDARWAEVVVWVAFQAQFVVLQERVPPLPFSTRTGQMPRVMDGLDQRRPIRGVHPMARVRVPRLASRP